jgi:exonuclease III
MDFPVRSKRHPNCPKETPMLCGRSTLGRGLCVKQAKDCKTRTLARRGILTSAGTGAGKNYAYVTDDLGRGCYMKPPLKMDYEVKNKFFDSVPENFNLLTYNIWGLAVRPSLEKLFMKRKDLLLRTLQNVNADIMCFQEMSAFAYNEMKDYIATYKFASEVPFPANEVDRNRSVEVYFMSRYKPKRLAVYSLPGVLNYANSMLIAEYPNLVVFNVYIQAGSKASIGQEETWIHYSRCRYDLLNIIYDMVQDKYRDLPIVVCGDFNFHHDGKIKDWPELEIIQQFKRKNFIDTFRHSNRRDPGLTEDTDLNMMRFNQKLMEKNYRYDAILYRPGVLGWIVDSSKIIGKETEYLDVADSKWFFNEVSEAHKKPGGLSLLKGVKKVGSDDYTLPINPSDHFGVLTKFKLSHRASRKKTMRAGPAVVKATRKAGIVKK